MLTQLIYISDAASDTNTATVEEILTQSQKFNDAESITGILMFTKKKYVQILEGDRKKISALYNRITHDPRHHNLELVSMKEICKRDFHHWSMAYIPDNSMKSNIILKYCSDKHFDPDSMTANQVKELFLNLAEISMDIE